MQEDSVGPRPIQVGDLVTYGVPVDTFKVKTVFGFGDTLLIENDLRQYMIAATEVRKVDTRIIQEPKFKIGQKVLIKHGNPEAGAEVEIDQSYPQSLLPPYLANGWIAKFPDGRRYYGYDETFEALSEAKPMDRFYMGQMVKVVKAELHEHLIGREAQIWEVTHTTIPFYTVIFDKSEKNKFVGPADCFESAEKTVTLSTRQWEQVALALQERSLEKMRSIRLSNEDMAKQFKNDAITAGWICNKIVDAAKLDEVFAWSDDIAVAVRMMETKEPE